MSLLDASFNGDLELLRALLEDPNKLSYLNIQNDDDNTPLTVASQYGHDSCVRALIEAGADPNLQNHCGFTVLIHASLNGHYSCVRALLEGGADPNIKDDWGYTALIEATKRGHEKCARFLLKAGADPNIINNYGTTAISMSIYHEKTKKMFKRINIIYFLKEYYEDCKLINFNRNFKLLNKLFNNNLIRELSLYFVK